MMASDDLPAGVLERNNFWLELPSNGTTKRIALKRSILYNRYWAYFHEPLPKDIEKLPFNHRTWIHAFTEGYIAACGMDPENFCFSVEWI